MMSSYKTIAVIGLASATLWGCNLNSGGGSGGSGRLSLDVTDAPVDEASEVNVVFEGVVLQAADGDRTEITFDEPKSINLLDLQGGETEALLEDETLAAGEYNWMRLMVNDDSNIVVPAGKFSLDIPSGENTGLKLVQGFTVPVNGDAAYTIDFDLRKSVVKTGQSSPVYKLKPALRLVDNTEVGSIAGTVDETVISDACDSEDTGAVYVFEGAGVTPVDVQGSEEDPIASGLVSYDEDNTSYSYEVAFLVTGDYTVSYTCDADQDDPEADDSANITFGDSQTVAVTAGETATADF